eukprot:990347-Rhodomonas_salina.1
MEVSFLKSLQLFVPDLSRVCVMPLLQCCPKQTSAICAEIMFAVEKSRDEKMTCAGNFVENALVKIPVENLG